MFAEEVDVGRSPSHIILESWNMALKIVLFFPCTFLTVATRKKEGLHTLHSCNEEKERRKDGGYPWISSIAMEQSNLHSYTKVVAECPLYGGPFRSNSSQHISTHNYSDFGKEAKLL